MLGTSELKFRTALHRAGIVNEEYNVGSILEGSHYNPVTDRNQKPFIPPGWNKFLALT
jgi:hypothetical protein